MDLSAAGRMGDRSGSCKGSRGFLGLALSAVAVWSGSTLRGQSFDEARANSHDDAWEARWVERAAALLYGPGAGPEKHPGMVLQIGDSITHANPYSQWPRGGSGRTPEDRQVLTWARANEEWPALQDDASATNGWYLAAADTSGQRGMTASTGLDAREMVTGDGNGGAPLPKILDPAQAREAVADGAAIPGNLQIDTIAAAFESAEYAVLLLGTNDASRERAAATFLADLDEILDALEARHIAVILSTIPPHPKRPALAAEYNEGIRALAQSRGHALIDLEAEILARRPGDSWNGTLLVADDVHPSARAGDWTSRSDPYAEGGDPATHTTGATSASVGYLLRSWLTVQKLKEVKTLVEAARSARALPGDCNGDGALDIGDAVCVLFALFVGGQQPLPCGDGTPGPTGSLALLDADGDGSAGIADAILLLRHLFLGGPGHVLGTACTHVTGCREGCD